MPEPTGPEPFRQESDRLTFAGLLGFLSVCLVQMLGVQTLSAWLLGSLFCFVAAIPLLVCSLRSAIKRSRLGQRVSRWHRYVDLVGVLTAVAGIALFIAHMNEYAGLAFLVMCGVAVVIARNA